MQGLEWTDWDDRPPPPEELVRVARLAIPLDEAFLTLARYQDEQSRMAADLLERETWALTALLERSAPLWQQAAQPTLRFEIGHLGEGETYHLEVGRFAHLAGLIGPTEPEQALSAAPGPLWARVMSHAGRRQAGQTGALACAYTPISMTEAIEILGCRRIVNRIEDATREVGRVLLSQAQVQAERQACLLHLEHMLTVASDAAPESRNPLPFMPARRVLTLLGTSTRVWLVLASAYLLCVVILCGAVIAAS